MEWTVGNNQQIMYDFDIYNEIKRQSVRLFTFLISFRAFVSEDNIKMDL